MWLRFGRAAVGRTIQDVNKRKYNAEERKSIVLAKVVGAVLLPLILIPLGLVGLLRQCQLFPESWVCSGESVLLSPAAAFLLVLLIGAYVYGVYHIFKGKPK